jgi:small ligand-binding sensory domain FIST
MRVAVGVSESFDPVEAFAEASAEARRGLDGPRCDLAVAFASPPHLGHGKWILSTIHDELAPGNLIGCGAGGVVGGGREIEDGAGAVVWAASLPGARIDVHHLEIVAADVQAPADGGLAARQLNGEPAKELDGSALGEALIVLADPYTFPTEILLRRLNEERPGLPVIGGLASAGTAGSATLFAGGEVLGGGAVACSLGGLSVLPCVSQGASPVGPEMAITAAEGNVISGLASKPAIERLGEAIESLDPRQQALVAEGLLLGVVIDENQPEYGRGDFLVRPIIGADREAGTIAVGERVRVGQTVRMHVRDGASADEDLRSALRLQAQALGSEPPAGALLFTCNGRGSHMFDVPDHDASAIEDTLGIPTGGFFCAGEIGPVGGRNFLHGFTATIALLAESR